MAEKITALCFLLGSIAYLFQAKQLAFGILSSPKSGFLPILAGVTTAVLALWYLVTLLQSKKPTEHSKVDWTKFIFIIIGLLFYITILTIIGYFAATFVLLFYLFKVTDTTGWIVPFVIAAVSSSVFYLVFAHYLAVTLP
ncbi:MAG TPA: tripartite tricarboxylate transporter TctB family protein [Negativicutes bacterium]